MPCQAWLSIRKFCWRTNSIKKS